MNLREEKINRMETRKPQIITQEEMQIQEDFAKKIKELENKPKTYFIATLGCQMNEHDSEKIAGMLKEMDILPALTKEEADFVIYNTCCIRDNAQRKALGNITWLKQLRKKKPELLIGVCGCMVQQPGMEDVILKQYKFVDIAFGTHNLHRFPQLLHRTLQNSKPVVEVLVDEYIIAEGIPADRMSPYHSFITIMYGCNNYCSYCIVPYVRGRERSRDPEDILEEARTLYKNGTKEIMLLGQNVNSYKGGEKGEVTFPKLLEMLDEVGIPRIRFMTSHPKDLSDELIEVMKNGKHICNQFHLPIQAGSDRILKAMNRHYNLEQYLQKVEKLRRAIPNIGITTDFIVAFPGETDEEFEETLAIVKKVGFDAAYSFIFSPREGTKAATMEGQLSKEVGKERVNRLLDLQEKMTQQVHGTLIGTIEEVLVEGISKKNEKQVSGKGKRGIAVVFEGNKEDIGKIIPVKIISSISNTLQGKKQ